MGTGDEMLKVLFIEVGVADIDGIQGAFHRSGISVNSRAIDDLDRLLDELRIFTPDIVISKFAAEKHRCREIHDLIVAHRPLTPLIVVAEDEDLGRAGSCLEIGATALVSKKQLDTIGPAVVQVLLTNHRFTSVALDAGGGQAFWIAPDGSITFANRVACQALGYEHHELLGMTVPDIDPTVSAETWRACWDELRQSRHMMCESIHQAKDGRTYPVEISTHFHEIGGNEYTYSLARDISDRKRAEEELLEREQELKRAEKMTHTGTWVIDLDSNTVTGSDESHRIYGLDEEKLPFEVIQEMALPEYRAFLNEALEELTSFGNGYDVEFKLRRATDGAIIDVHSVAEYIPEKNVIVGTIQDITAAKTVERWLQESEARYRLLFERNLAGVYRSTADGRILDCNDALASILGCASRDEAAQLDVRDLYFDASERERFLEALHKKKELRNFEVRLKRRDGKMCWCLLNSVLLHGEEGESATIEGTMIDITDLKRMEEQLLHSQKMETVGILAGGVAHDFNNILQAISGLANGFRRHPAIGQDVHERIEELEGLVHRGSQLTRQLLVFSRRDTVETRSLDINRVIDAYGKMLQDSLPENIDVSFELSPESLSVQADSGQLEQIVANLAINAEEAMPSGGRLVIRSGKYSDKWSFLEIEDDGLGMRKDVCEKAFEPFFTTKAADKSSGLGLSVVHGIVTRLGGRLEVDSEVDRGTRIRVLLPAQSEIAQPMDQTVGSSRDHSAQTASSELILVVEDERLVREGVQEMLISMGYKVETADSVSAALKAFADHPVNLLLTDMILPDGSGKDVIEGIRGRDLSVPIVIMTGYTLDSKSLEKYDFPVLVKPFTVARLAQTVRSALSQGGRPHDDTS